MSDIVRKEGVKPVRVLILGYLLLIAIGSVFLLLPISHKGHFSVIDSIFTSTSAVCVTGLIVKDTPVFFTPFGKTVLLILIQIGGIGYMSIITLFAMLVGRKMTLQEEMMIKTSYNHVSLDDIGRFALSVLKWTVVFESVGATIMFWRFMTKYHYSILHSLEKSIFHSVSAFCNAGFSLFSTSLVNFYNDFFIVGTIALLIILGGLGFFVLRDISASFKKRRKISEHSKIVLISTGVLLTVGFLLILFMEYNASLANYNIGGKLFISFFQSVTARTAGFNTVNIGSLAPASLLILIILMFIGA
ncbi:Trk family potassium uptake protein, partial [candidate division TA06 bacterium]